MQAFSQLSAQFMTLPYSNIDTDQIIPARFLTMTTKTGLGNLAFYDWRYDLDGRIRSESILNHQATMVPEILVAAENFGCGSSREHAVWALMDYGFRVILSPKIGDIFKSNALKNGLLAVEISAAFYQDLLQHPQAKIKVDLQQNLIEIGESNRFHFNIDGFARTCLLQGLDPLGFLLAQSEKIAAYERASL